MCCSTRRISGANGAAGPIRALHSLTSAQVSAVRSALRHLPFPWVLDEQEGYDGELTLILAPEEGHSDFSLALWRSPAGFHLCSLRGDEQIGCEILSSIDHVLRELRTTPGPAWHLA